MGGVKSAAESVEEAAAEAIHKAKSKCFCIMTDCI